MTLTKLNDDAVKQLLTGIYEQREEILRAFAAKYYGLEPDEVEQIIAIEGDKITWTVRKKCTS